MAPRLYPACVARFAVGLCLAASPAPGLPLRGLFRLCCQPPLASRAQLLETVPTDAWPRNFGREGKVQFHTYKEHSAKGFGARQYPILDPDKRSSSRPIGILHTESRDLLVRVSVSARVRPWFAV